MGTGWHKQTNWQQSSLMEKLSWQTRFFFIICTTAVMPQCIREILRDGMGYIRKGCEEGWWCSMDNLKKEKKCRISYHLVSFLHWYSSSCLKNSRRYLDLMTWLQITKTSFSTNLCWPFVTGGSIWAIKIAPYFHHTGYHSAANRKSNDRER